MSIERKIFKSTLWNRNLTRENVPRKLIKPTQQVVNNALRLVKQSPMYSDGIKEVFVEDPKTHRLFSITDLHAKERLTMSYSQLTDILSGGLFVYSLFYAGEDLVEGEGIQVPGLSELVTPKNISFLRMVPPSAMSDLAKFLKRAEIVNKHL